MSKKQSYRNRNLSFQSFSWIRDRLKSSDLLNVKVTLAQKPSSPPGGVKEHQEETANQVIFAEGAVWSLKHHFHASSAVMNLSATTG